MKLNSVYLSGLAYELGPFRGVDSVSHESEDEDIVALLKQRGVVSYAHADCDLSEMIRRSAMRTLDSAEIQCCEVDAIVVISESLEELAASNGAINFTRNARNYVFDLFASIGIKEAKFFSTAFGGSSNFLQAMFLISPLIEKGVIENALLVCADKCAKHHRRFMHDAIALVGDGVASCVVGSARPNIPSLDVNWLDITPYKAVVPYELSKMVLEMYKATKIAAASCYEALNLQPRDYAWLVQNNYNLTTSKIFAKMLGFPDQNCFSKNVPIVGHVPCCDTIVNITDLFIEGAILEGQNLLAYVTGPASCGTISLRARINNS